MKAITNITTGQKKQYFRFVEDAAERALKKTGLDKDGLQKLIENGDEFQSRIVTAVRELSVSIRYANEEKESNLGYLSGYKPKSITEQIKILNQLFPNIGFAKEKLADGQLPLGAEGWFAIPRWKKIAPTYGEAVQKVLDLIKRTRKGEFYNYCDEQLGPQYLRQSLKTIKAFQKLGDQQNGYDILVIPAQFGLRHRGRSVRRARECMSTNEFGLNAFAVGIMILTHPERLMDNDDLWIDCAGDEYVFDTSNDFSKSPCFMLNVAWIKLDTNLISHANECFGSASGFIFQ